MRKIFVEIDLAIKNNTVDELLEKYCVEIEEIPYFSGVTKGEQSRIYRLCWN